MTCNHGKAIIVSAWLVGCHVSRYNSRLPRIRHAGPINFAMGARGGMRIKTIEPIAVSLPMKKPVQMAGETVARADNVLVRVEAGDGAVGWGEAASAPMMTGETVASMMAAVELMTPAS